jgi:hypothetical protein
LRRALLCLAVLSLFACKPLDSLVVVSVSAGAFMPPPRILAVTATIDRTADFDFDPGADVSFPASFAIQIPSSYAGPVTASVTAFDANRNDVATGSGETSVAPGERSYIEIDLHRFVPDGGLPDLTVLSPNGAGERCGQGGCPGGLVCSGSYCLYPCMIALDCPDQTACGPANDQFGMLVEACVYTSGGPAAKADGAPCMPGDYCTAGHLCGDGICEQQCDSSGAPGCATGGCAPLTDARTGKIFAYTCRP